MNLTKIEMFSHRHFDQLNEIINSALEGAVLPLEKKAINEPANFLHNSCQRHH